MIRKLIVGFVGVGFGLVAFVGMERPAASDTPDDIVYFVGDQGGSCYLILNRGGQAGMKNGDRREVVGNITVEVVETYTWRAKARVANAKCADVLAHYKEATQPKKAPTASEIAAKAAAELAKKCDAEKDRIASTPDPNDKSRFKFSVYKAGATKPNKCTGETTIKVDGKDCGTRYCTAAVPPRSR